MSSLWRAPDSHDALAPRDDTLPVRAERDWRKVEHESYTRGELDGRVSWRGVGKTRPVDTVGQLPRGEEFKTFAEFKDVVVKNYQDDLVRGLLKNLMIYSTGRLPGIDDRAEIAGIMKRYRSQSYPLRDMLKAVVRSQAFLEQPAKIQPVGQAFQPDEYGIRQAGMPDLQGRSLP